MKNGEQKVNITVPKEAVQPDGSVLVNVLSGEFKHPKDPLSINLDGDIDMPAIFINGPGRKEAYANTDSHIIVNEKERSAKFVGNVTDPIKSKAAIIGKISLDTDFEALGLQKGKSDTFTPAELADTLRMFKPYFPTEQEYIDLINKLKKFTAKLEHDMEHSNNDRGTKKTLSDIKLNTDIPETLTLNMPMLKRKDKVEFVVNIFMDYDDRYKTVTFWLQSTQVELMLRDAIQAELERVADIFRKLEYPVFYI